MGGMIAAIEQCYPQKEIQEAAYQYQQAIECGQKIVVGVNQFVVGEESKIDTLYIKPAVGKKQLERLGAVKTSRNYPVVQQSLMDLGKAASANENLMPFLLSCVKAYATLGEVCDQLKQVFGTYQEPIF